MSDVRHFPTGLPNYHEVGEAKMYGRNKAFVESMVAMLKDNQDTKSYMSELKVVDFLPSPDFLLSRWVDNLNALRESGLTPEVERYAYAALREFIDGMTDES